MAIGPQRHKLSITEMLPVTELSMAHGNRPPETQTVNYGNVAGDRTIYGTWQ